MSIDDAINQYLEKLSVYIDRAQATGETTPELSYRPVLDGFLRMVAGLYSPKVDIIFEPKMQGHAGRPDWRIYNTENYGLYGFVEAKALDPTRQINISQYIDQITKYLGIGNSVILTDGLEFNFFEPHDSGNYRRYSLVEKPIRRNLVQEDKIEYLLDEQFRKFFREAGLRQCTEEQLIRETAVRAKGLADCVLVLSQAPLNSGFSEEENRTIEILHDLKTTLQLHHDPVLEQPKVFADFISQVLSFGLLYAHRVVARRIELPRDRYAAISRFWADAVYASYTDRLIPFKALVKMLESELSPEEDSTSQLKCWYDDTRRLLAHVQLREDQEGIPDYHTLYEKFFVNFDPITRFDFGAFYTPPELACFMVGMANTIIETSFMGRHLYEKGNKVVDPCCGTGTFIEQLVRHSVNKSAIHIVGFEILPAPYALAHYRSVMLAVPDAPNHRIDIFLTNTLSDDLPDTGIPHPVNVLKEELRRARNCARPPIVLVIGNPPSSDSFGPHSTGPNFATIDRLLEDFRPAATERRTRQNTQKQIGNDFMKFLRWAADKVLATEMGVLAFVLPSTFAAHPTYRHAREWFIRKFTEFWVLDIDRDLRTGVRSSSLFNTQQGRMLLIATHVGPVPPMLNRRLHYAAITEKTRTQKKLFLNMPMSNEDFVGLFTLHDIDRDSKAFRPGKNDYDRALYEQFWPIYPKGHAPRPNERCIFARHCSGTKLAPTALFVHPRRPILERRCLEIGDVSKSYEDLNARWFLGQSKPPAANKLIPEVRARIRAAANNAAAYHTYAFRPFVSEQVLLDNELLRLMSGLGGGGTRLRPEVISAFSTRNTVGIAIAPSPLDIGQELHRFATFCWDIPDNDLCSRGNAHVFCNRFPENKPPRGRNWDPTPKDNIADLLFDSLRGVLRNITSSDIVFYTYAALCSGTLLEAFASAYYTASATENIPRVPIVNDETVLQFLIEKGREMAKLENPHDHHELGSWVKPFKEMFRRSFNLMSFSVDPERLEIRLYGDGREPEVSLKDIPVELLQMTISGYETIACWLKFHSYTYTRCQFNRQEYNELLELLSALSRQMEIIGEIDTVMERVLSRDINLL